MSKGSVTLVKLSIAFPIPETRAQLTQAAVCQAAGNWSSVECIAPRQEVPLRAQTRPADRSARRFAVDNVEGPDLHASHILSTRRFGSCGWIVGVTLDLIPH